MYTQAIFYTVTLKIPHSRSLLDLYLHQELILHHQFKNQQISWECISRFLKVIEKQVPLLRMNLTVCLFK